MKDRAGHDKRYALDVKKIKKDIGWQSKYSFESSLLETVDWYLTHYANKNKNISLKLKKIKYVTYDSNKQPNGYLVPIYNINEEFFDKGKEPEQFYLTVIEPGKIKGPHLHYIRTGCFTCIKGNACFVVKKDNKYEVIYSGEDYEYTTVIIPAGTSQHCNV